MHTKRLVAWIATGSALFPSFAFAQGVPLDFYIVSFGGFINKFVIPIILALAFVFFVYNAVRYFVIGGANTESQQKAKMLALWGVLAFIFIVSIWGLVNAVVSSLGLTGNRPFCPDYNPNCGVNYADPASNRQITPDPLRTGVNAQGGPQEPPPVNSSDFR